MKAFLRFILGLLGAFLVFNLLLRILKNFIDIPMPEFLAPVIDNPLRRRWMPPTAMAARHGVRPGMRVLEIGPGSGSYTLAAARLAGPKGEVVAIDVNPKMIHRVVNKVAQAGVENVDARVGSVYLLPFPTGHFDAAYMMFVLGEIPNPPRAMAEIHRVLAPGGTLAITEGVSDPDYSLASTVIRLGEQLGFRVKQQYGNFFLYTVVLEKVG
ncbi:MAG TPA: methyltransferase domain-containing protein [Anaerolineaceae bacterium]|nr:methyltransferase domain-containing protein [Anaerolineaceae bacterium]